MFGKEYANHLDVLNQSFIEMNEQYKKTSKKQVNNSFIEKLKKAYIIIFGIPEIGFQIRSMYFQRYLASSYFTNSPKNILDAGSGIGTYSFYLSTVFPHASIIGGDIDTNKLLGAKKLKREMHQKNVEFISLDITKKQYKSQYDLIVIIDVLEHIEKYDKVLQNLYTLLQKNGYLYIHVPQPKQKRIFKTLRDWHHMDHAHEGISKSVLKKKLHKLGFKVLISKETFGFFGKLAWELNHIMLSKSLILAGISYPLLYGLAKLDIWHKNKDGLGVAILAKKIY